MSNILSVLFFIEFMPLTRVSKMIGFYLSIQTAKRDSPFMIMLTIKPKTFHLRIRSSCIPIPIANQKASLSTSLTLFSSVSHAMLQSIAQTFGWNFWYSSRSNISAIILSKPLSISLVATTSSSSSSKEVSTIAKERRHSIVSQWPDLKLRCSRKISMNSWSS